MKKLGNKIEAIPIVRKLNSHRWMSLVWWGILVMILPYIFSICRVPVVWREAILFFIINSIIAYYLGNLIIKLNLPSIRDGFYSSVFLSPSLLGLGVVITFFTTFGAAAAAGAEPVPAFFGVSMIIIRFPSNTGNCSTFP